MVNWAELPDEIINEIAKRMNFVGDFVRFACVCQSWRSVAAISKPSFSPWLILPEQEPLKEDDDFEDEDFVVKTFFDISLDEEEIIVPKWFFDVEKEEEIFPRRFFDISSNRVIELELPEAHARRCWGSPHGWLLTLGLDLNIHLLNPLNRQQIPLPSQTNFKGHDYDRDDNQEPPYIRQFFIEKFALSSNPTHPGCVVMVIYSIGKRLAYATPGDDKCWTLVNSSKIVYDDIIFFNNLFYLVDAVGNINFCDVSQPHPEGTSFMPPPRQVSPLLKLRHGVAYVRFYLVDVCGDLCLVVRVLFEDANAPPGRYRVVTRKFQVYKLEFSTKSWIKMGSLPNYAVFVGTNTSFAVSTSDQPQLKSNSIYFTDDYAECFPNKGCDIGLFDLEKKKLSDIFYPGDDIHSMFCPPVLFAPNPIFQ